ncbi:MAG: hypothetical protein L3J65_00805 [Robiginitomaculum sp.]|nr:hypothetical protein [Robiginitomaculum sp.]
MKTKLITTTIWLAVTLTACSEPTPPPPPNLMVLATEASGEDQKGMIDASFLTVSGAENCEERVEAARAVFPAAKIVYSWHYCAYSDINFEEFGHEPVPTGTAYYFDLDFSKDGKTLKSVTTYESNAACEKAKKGVCIVSYQNITE